MRNSRQRRLRRRLVPGLLLMLVLLASLWGANRFGWLGLGLDPTPAPVADSAPERSSSSSEVRPRLPGDHGESDRSITGEAVVVQVGSAPSTNGASQAIATEDRGEVSAADRDRAHGLTVTIREATREHRFYRALTAVERLEAIPGCGGKVIREEVMAALAEQFALAKAAAEAGRVLFAADVLASLLTEDSASREEVQEQCAATFGDRGCPELLGVHRPIDQRLALAAAWVPDPAAPLRVRFRENIVSARFVSVAGDGSDRWTVRVQAADGGGVFFPSVPRVSAEPLLEVVEQAIGQGAAAARLGDRAVAVLWWVRAHALDPGAQSLESLRTLVDG